MDKNSKGLKVDAFVAVLKPNPNSTDKLHYLQGFVGESDQEGTVRVYTDETLNDYMDLQSGDIAHAVARSKEENPLGGYHLWMKQDAKYAYGERPEASFLDGDSMNQYQESMYQGQAENFGAAASLGGFCQITTTTIGGTIRPTLLGVSICRPVTCFNQRTLCNLITCNNKISVCRPCVPVTFTRTIGITPTVTRTVVTATRPFDDAAATGAYSGEYNPYDYLQGDLYGSYQNEMQQQQQQQAAAGGVENMAGAGGAGATIVCPSGVVCNTIRISNCFVCPPVTCDFRTRRPVPCFAGTRTFPTCFGGTRPFPPCFGGTRTFPIDLPNITPVINPPIFRGGGIRGFDGSEFNPYGYGY